MKFTTHPLLIAALASTTLANPVNPSGAPVDVDIEAAVNVEAAGDCDQCNDFYNKCRKVKSLFPNAAQFTNTKAELLVLVPGRQLQLLVQRRHLPLGLVLQAVRV